MTNFHEKKLKNKIIFRKIKILNKNPLKNRLQDRQPVIQMKFNPLPTECIKNHTHFANVD
jgi:hypothetical protein